MPPTDLETFLAEDAVTFGMDATRDEFETGLQLLHALLTEPYLEPVAFAQWKQGMADVLREQAHNPSVALARWPRPLWEPLQRRAPRVGQRPGSQRSRLWRLPR